MPIIIVFEGTYQNIVYDMTCKGRHLMWINELPCLERRLKLRRLEGRSRWLVPLISLIVNCMCLGLFRHVHTSVNKTLRSRNKITHNLQTDSARFE